LELTEYSNKARKEGPPTTKKERRRSGNHPQILPIITRKALSRSFFKMLQNAYDSGIYFYA
jgi:hypothetical protein